MHQRLNNIDWAEIKNNLNIFRWVLLENILNTQECEILTEMYSKAELFRSKVIMARHGFGSGEYQYFSYPLPALIHGLREAMYPPLAAIANDWNAKMNLSVHYPVEHTEFLERCHQAGQIRPTPLLLKYKENDFNCLHQDVYDEHVFPLQVVFLLSEPGRDFSGGECILTEQRPRMQTKAEVIPLRKGSALVLPVHHRPKNGSKGYYRVNMRHGVSRLRSGQRHSAGIIFHDAV